MIKYLLKRWWVQALIVLAVCAITVSIAFLTHNPIVGAAMVITAYGIWLSVFGRAVKSRRRADGSPR